MSLKDLVRLIRFRWRFGAAAAAVTLAAGIAYWLLRGTLHTADANLSVPRDPAVRRADPALAVARGLSAPEAESLFRHPHTLDLITDRFKSDEKYAKWSRADVVDRLEIETIGDPPVHVVRASAPRERDAVALAAAAASVFGDVFEETLKARLQSASADLENRRAAALALLTDSRQGLIRLKDQYGFDAADTSVDGVVDRLTRAQLADRRAAESARIEIARLEGVLPSAAALADEPLTSPDLDGALAGLAKLREKLADLRLRFTDEHRDVVGTLDAIHELEAQLPPLRKAAVEILLAAKKTEADAADKRRALSEAQLDRVLKDRTTVARLFIDVASRERELKTLQQAADDLRLELTVVGRHTAVHLPTFGRLVAGRRQWGDLYLLGLIAALVGLGSAYAREHFDNSIRDPVHITRYANLGVLGTVPAIEDEDVVLSDVERPSPLGEVHARIAAVLIKTLAGATSQSLVVTSAHPDEGKTVTALNLAVTLARLGHSTILVDADMRRGRLHDLLHQDNSRGLSSLLERKEAARAFLDVLEAGGPAPSPAAPGRPATPMSMLPGDLRALQKLGQEEVVEARTADDELPSIPREEIDRVLRPTEIPRLLLIPTGPGPANPAALLESVWLRSLLVHLKHIAEYVVIDAPPMHGCGDPPILASKADATLLVVRAHKTQRTDLHQAKRTLEGAGARLIGTVMTFTGARESGYYAVYGLEGRKLEVRRA